MPHADAVTPETRKAVASKLIAIAIKQAIDVTSPSAIVAILVGEAINSFARLDMPSGAVAQNLRRIADHLEQYPEVYGFTQSRN